MADGSYKNIEDVNVGNYVLSYNELNKNNVAGKVIKVYIHPKTEGYWLVNDYLRVTPNHRFFINRKWEPLFNAEIGDYLIDPSGNSIKFNSFINFNSINTIYNLEIEKYHTYYAGDILVHNRK